MLDAAVKAIAQMFSPELRRILWRAIGLALVLIAVVSILLQRALSWLATSGETWAETTLGPAITPRSRVVVGRLDRRRLRHPVRRGVPDAGDHVIDRKRLRR